MVDKSAVEALANQVQANPKYQPILRDLVLRLCADVLAKGEKPKTAVKTVRNKLHQVGGAYFKHKVNYAQSLLDLADLPNVLNDAQVQRFCLTMMQSHASSAERLPILEEFFTTCLDPIQPVTSVLDLACGFNPLALPWMPLAAGCTYRACDIFLDMLQLVQSFFNHFDFDGVACPCDLAHPMVQDHVSQHKVQVAFLLKSIPCLEQVDKAISIPLLNAIRADHILVSFPVSSLTGKQKGMPSHYRDHFYQLLSETNWQIQEFVFQTELAFLVTK